MAWDTATTVINDAALELALVTSSVADVYASTDANVVQLRALLKALGRELVREYAWSHLQKTHTFSTVDGTATYALPADFARMADQTQWNRTTELPLGGPLSPQGYQLLKATTAAGVVEKWFRVSGNVFELYPVPTAAETIAYEYLSAYWVQPSGESAPTAEAPTANTDTLWMDPHLLTRGLIYRWLSRKGFPTTDVALRDYESALDKARSGDGAAPVLRLDRGPFALFRPLDGSNVPETGYGS